MDACTCIKISVGFIFVCISVRMIATRVSRYTFSQPTSVITIPFAGDHPYLIAPSKAAVITLFRPHIRVYVLLPVCHIFLHNPSARPNPRHPHALPLPSARRDRQRLSTCEIHTHARSSPQTRPIGLMPNSSSSSSGREREVETCIEGSEKRN